MSSPVSLRRIARRLLPLAAALAVCTAAGSAAAPPRSGDDCVILPGASAGRAAAPASVISSRDSGNLTEMEFAGDYTYDLTAPRQAVAQRFYQDHPDQYDFLIVFTTFDFDWGSGSAYYHAIRNDVSGIGWPLLDYGGDFGSSRRLQGYVDMTRVERLPLSPRDPRYRETRNTLAHELMHRWTAKLRYRDAGGEIRRDLIGHQDAHWSHFLDTNASLMYGARWEQRSDGRFEATAVTHRYGPLDLYAAGFAAASEVPPLKLIRNGDGDPASLPVLGARSGGSQETISLDQIIAAEGPRIPDSASAPKDFRAALIVLKRPGETVPAEVLAGLEALRIRTQQHFTQLTDGRASLRVFTQRLDTASAQLPPLLAGSGNTAAPPGVAVALDWIKQRQHTDGHWQDRPATALRDTAAALQLLREADPGYEGIARAESWLAAHSLASNDAAAWQLIAGDSAAAATQLQQQQSAAGGWGLAAGLADSSLDTAAVAAALAQRDPGSAALTRALENLAARQHTNGSFGIASGGAGRMLPTLRAARAFAASPLPQHALLRDNATQWLLARQHGAGGGFGDGAVSLADTIELSAAAAPLSLSGYASAQLRQFVGAAQQRHGDWQGSVYLTALAARTQRLNNKPNLRGNGAPSYQPQPALDGDRVRLSVPVVNTGLVAAPASTARWYDGNPTQGGQPFGAAVALPALIPGASVAVSGSWDSRGLAGARELWLQLDDAGSIDELDEDDNRIAVPVQIEAAPAQPDIVVDAAQLSLTPASIAGLPASVTLSGQIANLGQQAAAGVVLRLYRDGTPRQLLAQTTLDLPARGSVPLQLAFDVVSGGNLRLLLQADPDNAVAEARENNNEASLLLPLGQSLDLEVLPGDLSLLDGTAVQGRDTGLRVRLHNRGTVDSPPAQLLVQVQQGAGSQSLLDQPVQIAAGQSIERRLYWRAATAGPATLQVQLDPAGAVAESNETNNQAQLDFNVAEAPQQVDLAIEAGSLQFTPATALQGQPLALRLRVRNLGSVVAEPFAVLLYAADPQQGGAALARLDVAEGLPAQAVREVVLQVANLQLSRSSELFVVADALQQIAESNESNNSLSSPLTVLSLPDVAVSAAAVALTPAQPVPGEPLQARVDVRNLGGQPAQQVRVRLLEGLPGAGVAAGAEQVIAELAAGATAQLQWNWTFGLQPQANALTVLADPERQLRENDIANNNAVLPLDIQDRDFYASDRYLSPDGDGVRDSTTLAFARLAPGPLQVEIRNAAGRVVRRYDNLVADGAERGQVVWDGRDDAGRIELDGDYQASLLADGVLLAQLNLVLDLNRASVFTAANTPLLLERRLAWWPDWLQPPSAGPARNHVYALIRREQIPPQQPLDEYGIYRSSVYWPALEPIVSAAVLATGQEIAGFDADSFSSDGRQLAFYRTGSGSADVVVAASDARDQLRVLDTLSGGVPLPPRFLGTQQLLAGTTQELWLYDLASGARRAVPLPPGTPQRLQGHVHGAVVWSAVDGAAAPAPTYYALDSMQPLSLPPGAQADADGARFQLRRVSSNVETAAVVDSRDGREQVLRQRPEDDFYFVHADAHYRPQHLHATWLGHAQDSLVLVDSAQRLLQLYAGNGALRLSVQLPPADPGLEIDPPPDRFIGNDYRRVGGVGLFGCQGLAWCGAANLSEGDRRLQWYDPATRRLTLMLSNDTVGAIAPEGVPPYVVQRYAGAAEVFVVDLDDGSFERIAAGTGDWPLPPLLRLRDGAALGWDGLLRSAAGIAAATRWEFADALLQQLPFGFGGDDRGLHLSSTSTPVQQRHLASIGNLGAELRASARNGGIELSGIAADHHFDHYRLDWASAAEPDTWHALQPPSADPVTDASFGTWLPPLPGHYRVRLSVSDRAGNTATALASALATAATSIGNISVQSRFFSPNGDGVRDTAVARFHVIGTQTVALRVRDAQQRVLREQVQPFGAGEHEFAWDGRDGAGQLQPDGDYRIEIQGSVLPVVLENTPPQLQGEFEQPGASYTGIDGASHIGAELTVRAQAADSNLEALWLERSPRGAATWTRLTEPAPGSPVSASGAGRLAGQSLRAQARDRAGNSVTLALGDAVDSVQLGRCRGRAGACAQQKPWWFENVNGGVPGELPAAPQVLVEDLLQPLMLSLLDASGGYAAVDVEMAVADASPQWRVVHSLPATGASFRFDDPYERRIDIPVTLTQVAPGSDVYLRAVGVGGDGNRIASNAIRVLVQPLGEPIVVCAGASVETVPAELRPLLQPTDDGVPQILLPIHNAAYLDSTRLELTRMLPFHRYSIAASEHNAYGAVFRSTFFIGTLGRGVAPLTAERWLKGPLKMLGCSGGGNGDGPEPPDFSVASYPQVNTACNAPPSGLRRVIVNSPAPMFWLRVSAFSENTEASIFDEVPVANEGPSGQGKPTWTRSFDWNVSGLPQGEVFLNASSDQGRAGSRSIIDHEPPIALLDFPAPGSRLCATTADSLRLRFGGNVAGGSRAFFKLELSSRAAPDQRYCVAERLVPGSCQGWQPVQADDGTLAQIQDNALASLNGEVEAELRAHDESGALACSSTAFYLDSAVEADALPAPPGLLAQTLLYDSDPVQPPRQLPLLGLAPQGAPEYRRAVLGFNARESVGYRLSLHAASAYGNGYLAGAELAELATGADIEGSLSLGWDGRIAGEPADDATYLLRLVVVDSCGNRREQQALVLLDSRAPQLAIDQPAPDAMLTLPVVEILGSVNDAHFSTFEGSRAYWQLRVQLADAPEQLLADRDYPVAAALLGRWNRGTALGNGRFLLRAVDDLGNSAELQLPFSAPSAATLIAAASLSPDLFSPNGDGRLDQTELKLTLLRAAQVDVQVRDGSDSVVATLAAAQPLPAGLTALSWDGSSAQALADGSYRVHISARDAADPGQSEAVQLSLLRDTTAPVLSQFQPAANATAQGVAGFQLDEARLDRYDARLYRADSAAPLLQRGGAATGTIVLLPLAALDEGDYRLLVTAQDRAGNSSEHEHRFRLDKRAPQLQWLAPETNAVLARNSRVALRGSVEDAGLERYAVELAPQGSDSWIELASGSSSVTAASLGEWLASQADGDYQLRLSARDHAGNSASLLRAVSVDGTPPQLQLTEPADGASLAANLRLRGSVGDAHLQDYLVAIATPSAALAGQWTPLHRGSEPVANGILADLQPGLPDGDYVLRVVASDRAGLTTAVQVNIRIDRVAPGAPLQLRGRIDGGDAVLDWTAPADADLAGYAVYRNGQRLNSVPVIAPHYVDAALADGQWQYQISAIDRAGNEGEASNRVQLLLDRTPPRVAIDAPAAAERVGGDVSIRGSAYSSDDFASWRLSVRRSDGSDSAQLVAESSLPVQGGEFARWPSRAYPDGTAVTLRLEARDSYGNSAAAERSVVVDNAPPAAPQGLVVTLSGADAQLAWNANGEPDLRGYLLYRNGRLINGPAQTPADLRPFALTALAYTDADVPDGNHAYQLFAIDQAGNLSAPSAPAPLAVDRLPPQLTLVSPREGEAFESRLSLLATTPHVDIASVRFAYRAVGDGNWTEIEPLLTQPPYALEWDAHGLPLGEYELRAAGIDASGQTDNPPPQARVRRGDLTAPQPPAQFRAEADGASVNLHWQRSSSSDVAGYRIERNDGSWQVLAERLDADSFVDTAPGDGNWSYRISAVDVHDNASAAVVDAANVFSLVLEQPFTPTDAATTTLAGHSPVPGQVQLRIVSAGGTQEPAPQATDAYGRFELGGVALPAGNVEFIVRVREETGDRSRAASVNVLRDAAPATPTGLGAQVTGYDVDLNWNAVAEPDVIGYRLQRNDRYVLPDAPLPPPLAADAVYCCNAPFAADGDPATAWQLQGYLAPPAQESGADPTLQIALPQAQILTALALDWSDLAQASGNVDVYARTPEQVWVRVARQRQAAATRLEIALPKPYRSDALRVVLRAPQEYGGWTQLALAELSLVVRPLIAATAFSETVIDGQHRYRVSAVDSHALESMLSAPVPANVGDSVAPEPVVLDGSVAARDVTLSWTASTSTDVARYELRRDGQLIASLPAAAERRHVDALRPPGQYSYEVFALDAFHNASAASNRVSVQVDSGLAAPVLDAVDAPATGAALDLRWHAGDTTAVAQYLIHRSTSEQGNYAVVGATAATQWRDSGLNNGTRYWYRVVARDAQDVLSAPSAALSAVPRDRTAPAAAVFTYPTVAARPLQPEDSASRVCGRAENGSTNVIERNGSIVASVATMLPPATPLLALSGWLPPYEFAADGQHFAARRNGVWHIVDRTTLLGESTQSDGPVQWTRQGLWLYTFRDGRLHTQWPGRTAQPLAAATAASLRAFAVSPDRSRLLLLGRRDDADSADTLWLTAQDGSGARVVAGVDASTLLDLPPVISADGRRAAVATAERWLLLDLEQASLLTEITADTQAGASWSDDGELALIRREGDNYALWIYSSQSGDTQPRLALSRQPTALDWAPSGDQLALGFVRGVRVFDAASGDLHDAGPDELLSPMQLRWTASGRLLGFQYEGALLLQPPGWFCSEAIDLRPGLNRFDAVSSDAAGNRSLPAAGMTLTLSGIALPDLALDAAAIFFVPAAPAPGQPATALFTLRNRGSAAAPATTLQATLTAPDGSQQVFGPQPVGALAANAQQSLSLSLGTLAQTGLYRLRLSADPQQQINEADESNNSAEASLAVSTSSEPLLALSADSAVFAPGQSVRGEAQVSNPGPRFSGSLHLGVVDATGSAVADLGQVLIPALDFAASLRQRLEWATGAVTAGDYRLRARLLRADGSSVAERDAAFSIARVAQVELSSAALPALAAPGDIVELSTSLHYAAGNGLLAAAQLSTTLYDAAGTPLWSAEEPLGALQPGYRLQRRHAWSATAVGDYRLVSRLHGSGYAYSAESGLTVRNADPAVRLRGSLTLQPSATVAAGMPAQLDYLAGNDGSSTLAGVELRLQLYASPEQPPLLTRYETLDLTAAAQHQGSLALAPLPLALTAHVATLDARLPGDAAGSWRPLARQGFAVVDALAPQITLLAPAPQQWHGAVVPLSARISDDHSGLARADARIGDGPWQPLSLGADGRYTFHFAHLADGEHTLTVRAIDRWGNSAQTEPRRFGVDTQPPQILVSGVSDGEITRNTVHIGVSVSDAHVDNAQTMIQLDGTAYVPGTAISAEGAHTLSVRAADLAGNTRHAAVHFRIDTTAPPLSVLAPADGSVTDTSSILVQVQSEASARVNLQAGSFSAERSAGGDGRADFVDVPLLEGDNTLLLQAFDAAGNGSASVSVHVRYQPGGTQPLVGTLQPALAQPPHGQALQLQLQVRNNGSQALLQQPLRISVHDSANALTARQELQRDFAAGQQLGESVSFATTSWALGHYQLRLEALVQGSWILLDTQPVELVDRTPPTLQAQAPLAGAQLQPPLRLRASASDALSAPVTVEASLDDGAWFVLTALATPAGSYESAELSPSEGAHQYRLRARDAAGNEAVLPAIAFGVDTTAPLIAIGGVSDGDLLNHAVTPVITISDANLAGSDIRLNGTPFSSGSSVAASGDYLLRVEASDSAGNTQSRELRFRLDLDAPVIVVSEPVPGSTVTVAPQEIAGTTEALAQVHVIAPGLDTTVQAGADGRFRTAAATLVAGSNTLRLSATDAAGNSSAELQVSVTYQPPPAQLLNAQDLDGHRHLRRGRPVVTHHRLRNDGEALNAIAARTQLRTPDGSVVAQDSYTVTLPAAGETNRSSSFASDALLPGSYHIVLAAQLRNAQGIVAWTDLVSTPLTLLPACRAPPRAAVADRVFNDSENDGGNRDETDDSVFCDGFQAAPPPAPLKALPAPLGALAQALYQLAPQLHAFPNRAAATPPASSSRHGGNAP